MRRLLFLFISYCFLLPAFNASGQMSQKAYYFASISDVHPGQPKFMDGIFMDEHHRKVIFRNVVEVKDIIEKKTPETSAPVSDIKPPEVTNVIKVPQQVTIDKSIPADNKELQPEIAKKTDPVENNEPNPITVKKTDPIEIKEINPPAGIDQIKSVDVVTVDMPEEDWALLLNGDDT